MLTAAAAGAGAARPRWVAPALGASVVVLLAVHLALHAWRTGPYQYQDELAYLAAARYLAGVGAEPLLSPMPFYYPGYSVVLAPLYLVLRDPGAVYHAALVVNAALAAALIVPLYLLATRLLGLSPGRAVLVAGVTATYPAFLLQSGSVWTESLVQLLFPLWALAGLALARRPTIGHAVLLSALSGVTFAVHARGAAMVLAALALVAALRLTRSLGTGAVSAAVAALAAILAGTRLLGPHLLHRIYEPAPTRPSELDLLRPLVEPGGWGELALSVCGQVWYLTVASLGLAPLGAIVLGGMALQAARDLRARRPPDPLGATAALVLIAVIAMLVISSAWMAASSVRVDHLVFGRYNEGAVAVLILAGLAALLRIRDARLAGALAGAGAGAVALAAVVWLGHGAAAFEGFVAPVAVLGVMAFTPKPHAIPVLQITLTAALATAVLLGLALTRRVAATVALAVFFLASAITTNDRFVKPFSAPPMTLVTTRAIADHLTGLGPVSYDRASNTLFPGLPIQNLHQFWLQDAPLLPFNSAAGEGPRSDLVIAATDWPEGERRGARVVYPETTVPQALWVLPGPAQDALARRGLLLPSPLAHPLPPAAARATVRAVLPQVLAAGGDARLEVAVRHAGAGSPWPPAPAVPPPHVGGVQLAASWRAERDGASGGPVATQLGELTRTVLPGESVSIPLQVAARGDDGAPLAPGRYRVRLVMLQHGIAPLDTAGDVESTVVVVAGS